MKGLFVTNQGYSIQETLLPSSQMEIETQSLKIPSRDTKCEPFIENSLRPPQPFKKKKNKRDVTFSRQTLVSGDEQEAMNKIFNEEREKVMPRDDNKFRRRVKNILQNIPVLSPDSNNMVIWNIFVSALVIFYFYEIPIYIVWGVRFWTTKDLMPKVYVESFTDMSYIVFWIDIGVNFITAYYEHGNLVIKKSKIANHYMKGNLTSDLIAVIAFTIRVSLDMDSYRWLYFIFYFRLPSLLATFEEFDELVLLHKRARTSFQIAKILLFMFYAFFTFGCFFNLLGRWCIEQQLNSWLLNAGNFGVIVDKNVHEQFFFSIYFSIGTLSSTMGYGDIGLL